MNNFVRRLVFSAFVTLVGASCAGQGIARGVTASIQMPGVWVGEGYFGEDGKFSRCTASLSYDDNTILVVSMFVNGDWLITLTNPNWKGRSGTIKIEAKFDRSKWFRAVAMKQGNTIRIRMVKTQDFINLFRSANYMYFRAVNIYEKLPLNGTYKLLPALKDCVNNNKFKKITDATVEDRPESQKRPPRTQTREPQKEEGGSSGTGISISADGHILTNNHVVDGCKRIIVKRSNATSTSARLLKEDARNDLAVLKINGQIDKEEIAEFADGSNIRLGEDVAVFGYPLHGILTTSGNFVRGNVTSLAGLTDDARYYQISAPVQPGNSGGPLLNTGGKVIGVVTGQINDFAVAAAIGRMPQNINFALKANIARNFLDAHSIPYNTSAVTTALSSVDLANRGKKISVFVQCE